MNTYTSTTCAFDRHATLSFIQAPFVPTLPSSTTPFAWASSRNFDSLLPTPAFLYTLASRLSNSVPTIDQPGFMFPELRNSRRTVTSSVNRESTAVDEFETGVLEVEAVAAGALGEDAGFFCGGEGGGVAFEVEGVVFGLGGEGERVVGFTVGGGGEDS